MRVARTASLERSLLMGRGLAAWIQACTEDSLGALPAKDPAAGGQEGDQRAWELPARIQAQVVQLLAEITWAVLRS